MYGLLDTTTTGGWKDDVDVSVIIDMIASSAMVVILFSCCVVGTFIFVNTILMLHSCR